MSQLSDPEVNLSIEAQEVLDCLKIINVHPETVQFLEEDSTGRHWLPMCNILNGHISGCSEEYIKLLEILSNTLHGNLINSKGGHSNTYYDLKRAGYKLWVTEQDSFGPLGSAIKCPDSNWNVGYG